MCHNVAARKIQKQAKGGCYPHTTARSWISAAPTGVDLNKISQRSSGVAKRKPKQMKGGFDPRTPVRSWINTVPPGLDLKVMPLLG